MSAMTPTQRAAAAARHEEDARFLDRIAERTEQRAAKVRDLAARHRATAAELSGVPA